MPFRDLIRSRLRTVLTALLALPLLAACAVDLGEPIALDMTEDQASPALWRVSDDDSSIYLFGTIHRLPRGVPWQTETVRAAFADAEMLVTESNAWFGDSWSTSRVIRLRGHYPADQSLRQSLTPSTLEELSKVIERLDLDFEELDRMRPWLVAWQLGGISAGNIDMRQQYGVETILYAAAEDREMPQSRLERAQDVLKAFADLDASEQEAMLRSALEDATREGDEAATQGMIEAWLRGDPDSLKELVDISSLARHPSYHELLIARRNRAWLDPLMEFLENDTNAFVAVGAAHLAGDDSVARMLAQWGYRVERLDPAGRSREPLESTSGLNS